MTSAVWLRYHLHFVQVGLIALYIFGENLSPSNNFDVIQNTVGHWVEEGELNCACIHASSTFLLWIILKRSSDRSWQVKDGNCAFLFLAAFHFPPPSSLHTCPKPDLLCRIWSSNQHAGNCLRGLGWKMHLRKVFIHIPTWELPDFPFLVFLKQVFKQPQSWIIICEISQSNQKLIFQIVGTFSTRVGSGTVLFSVEDSGAAQCTPSLSPH